MKLKTLTWNIGGGKLLADGSDPLLMASYSVDGLSDIKALLKAENPDIITLQETHKGPRDDQVAEIANDLGYKYFRHDSTSNSHIDTSKKLGHAIISRFPIIDHTTALFNNPNVQIEWEDGSIATSFDKGFSTCSLNINGQTISVITLHLIPFKRFGIQLHSETGRQMLNDVSRAVNPTQDTWIIQGDFNIDDKLVGNYFQPLFTEGADEIPITEPTTPKGNRYDHILFRNLRLISQRTDSTVKTDHYPVIATFETKFR